MVRVKFRYFLVDIKYAGPQRRQRQVSNEQVYRAVRGAIKESYGDYGLGALKDNLMVKYMNWETNIVIIRAKRAYYHMAQTALSLVKKIGDYDCFLHTLYIGGTINACQKFLILHHRHHLPMLLKQKIKMHDPLEKMDTSRVESGTEMNQSTTTTITTTAATTTTPNTSATPTALLLLAAIASEEPELMDCSQQETSTTSTPSVQQHSPIDMAENT